MSSWKTPKQDEISQPTKAPTNQRDTPYIRQRERERERDTERQTETERAIKHSSTHTRDK